MRSNDSNPATASRSPRPLACNRRPTSKSRPITAATLTSCPVRSSNRSSRSTIERLTRSGRDRPSSTGAPCAHQTRTASRTTNGLPSPSRQACAASRSAVSVLASGAAACRTRRSVSGCESGRTSVRARRASFDSSSSVRRSSGVSGSPSARTDTASNVAEPPRRRPRNARRRTLISSAQ